MHDSGVAVPVFSALHVVPGPTTAGVFTLSGGENRWKWTKNLCILFIVVATGRLMVINMRSTCIFCLLVCQVMLKEASESDEADDEKLKKLSSVFSETVSGDEVLDPLRSLAASALVSPGDLAAPALGTVDLAMVLLGLQVMSSSKYSTVHLHIANEFPLELCHIAHPAKGQGYRVSIS